MANGGSVSNTLPPVLTTASKLEQAREKVSDLFLEADHARHCAHEAAAALELGNLELAGQYLREAEKHAGVLPARVTWASHAVTSAQAEVSGGR